MGQKHRSEQDEPKNKDKVTSNKMLCETYHEEMLCETYHEECETYHEEILHHFHVCQWCNVYYLK